MSVELIIKVTGYDIDDALGGGDPGLVLTREDAERLIVELICSLTLSLDDVERLLEVSPLVDHDVADEVDEVN